METEQTDFEGGCHCGAVRLKVHLPQGLKRAGRCSCTICAMRGAVMLFAPLEALAVTKGQESLTCYRFNTGVAEHFFCSVCGVYTHHRRRLDPNEYAVNAACLDGVSPFDFEKVRVMDGRHHPRDDPDGRVRMLGVLRFERDEDVEVL